MFMHTTVSLYVFYYLCSQLFSRCCITILRVVTAWFVLICNVTTSSYHKPWRSCQVSKVRQIDICPLQEQKILVKCKPTCLTIKMPLAPSGQCSTHSCLVSKCLPSKWYLLEQIFGLLTPAHLARGLLLSLQCTGSVDEFLKIRVFHQCSVSLHHSGL